jgi:hypothetical protein
MLLMGALALVLIVVGLSWIVLNLVSGGKVAPLRVRLGWVLVAAGVIIIVLAQRGVFPVN